MKPADVLIPRWLERASELSRYGSDERAAALWRLAAAELGEISGASENELLSLNQAAAESGYSADHLGRLVRNGVMPNAGRKHAPRIRRGDLAQVRAGGRPRLAEEPPADDSSERLFRNIVTSKLGA